MDLETIRQEVRAVAEELITTAQMKPGTETLRTAAGR